MASPDRATRDEVDERVGVIEALMRRAQWERGRSNRVMAKQWDCSVDAVNDYAAEAGRRVRAEVTDRDEVQVTVCAALSTVVREGLRDGDRAAVVRAGDVWSRVVGARAAERHEHSFADDFEAMSPSDKSAWLRAKAAEMIAEADAIDAPR
jgi:hypothetical protein